MRIVLNWEEFKMIELLFIHLKENAYKKEKGSIRVKDYEISWNPQVMIIDLEGKALVEKILLSLEGLEER
jgi:hypothetical protein